MALADLKARYLWIANQSLKWLKEEGFSKKGTKYIKQKGDLVLKIYPLVPRPYLNDDRSYEFVILWEITSLDPELIQLCLFMGAPKNTKEAELLLLNVLPKGIRNRGCITDQDPPTFDEDYAKGIQQEIKEKVLPLFNRLESLDDVIRLAEEEEKLERKERVFFPHAIYGDLARFYAAKGWQEKALQMCEKDIEQKKTIPGLSPELAEERKKKYIRYFEKFKKKGGG